MPNNRGNRIYYKQISCRMNILYVMRFWPVYGGGETVTVTLANEFIRRGHKVDVAYLFWKEISPMPYTVNAELECHHFDDYDATDNDSLRLFSQLLDEKQIDVIINQWGNSKFIRLGIGNRKCKLITCWHQEVLTKFSFKLSFKKKIVKCLCPCLYQWNEKRWRLKIHKNNIRNSDKYVFLTPAYLKQYNSLTNNADANKVEFIFNPLTYSHFFSLSSYCEKEKMVLFVGRIEEASKRISYVIKIWQRLCLHKKINDWKLVIVGDGPDLAKTMHWI